MKGYVILLLLIGLSANFIPAHGIKCYQCHYHEKDCEKPDDKFKTDCQDNLKHCFKIHVTGTVETDSSKVEGWERGCKETIENTDCTAVAKTGQSLGPIEKCTVCSEEGCNGDEDLEPKSENDNSNANSNDSNKPSSTDKEKNSGFAVQGIPVWALLMYVAATKMFTVAK